MVCLLECFSSNFNFNTDRVYSLHRCDSSSFCFRWIMNHMQEVKHWLQSIKMIQYETQFIQRGFNTLDIVTNITTHEELQNIGVSERSDRCEILHHVQILKQNRQNIFAKRKANEIQCSTKDILSQSVDFNMEILSEDGKFKYTLQFNLRDPIHRKVVLIQLQKDWAALSFNAFEIPHTDQVNKDRIYEIIQYQLVTDDTKLYQILMTFRSNMMKSEHHYAYPLVPIGHFIQICSLIFTNTMLLKYFFNFQIKTSKIFLSLLIRIIFDKFNRLKPQEISTYMWILTDTGMYWKREHFEYMIQNDLCAVLKKYITKLRCGTKMNIMIAGVMNGDGLRTRVQNLVAMIRCFTNKLYYNDKNDNILKLYKSELHSVFFTKSYNSKIKHLTIAYKVLAWCDDSVNIFMNIMISAYKERRISHCAWVLCNNSDEEYTLYVCKRCKLILYCCRNHQKKHWKYIHSQQCLNTTNSEL
eukprot:388636_1